MALPNSWVDVGVIFAKHRLCCHVRFGTLWEVGREMEWDVGITRYKFLYVEQINNKVLLYSTENYMQYPMINHNENEYF